MVRKRIIIDDEDEKDIGSSLPMANQVTSLTDSPLRTSQGNLKTRVNHIKEDEEDHSCENVLEDDNIIDITSQSPVARSFTPKIPKCSATQPSNIQLHQSSSSSKNFNSARATRSQSKKMTDKQIARSKARQQLLESLKSKSLRGLRALSDTESDIYDDNDSEYDEEEETYAIVPNRSSHNGRQPQHQRANTSISTSKTYSQGTGRRSPSLTTSRPTKYSSPRSTSAPGCTSANRKTLSYIRDERDNEGGDYEEEDDDFIAPEDDEEEEGEEEDFIAPEDEEEDEAELEEDVTVQRKKRKNSSSGAGAKTPKSCDKRTVARGSGSGTTQLSAKRRKTIILDDDDDEGQSVAGGEEEEESAEVALEGLALYRQVQLLQEQGDEDEVGGDNSTSSTRYVPSRSSSLSVPMYRKSYSRTEAMRYYLEMLARAHLSSAFLASLSGTSSGKSSDNARGHMDVTKYLDAARQLENVICTTRESLVGSGAWNEIFSNEMSTRPFYAIAEIKTDSSYKEEIRCQACNRRSQNASYRIYFFGTAYHAKNVWNSVRWGTYIPPEFFLHNKDTAVTSEKIQLEVEDAEGMIELSDSSEEEEDEDEEDLYDYKGKPSKENDSRKKRKWWMGRWPTQYLKGEATQWYLNTHCKLRCLQYHTLLHYKLRLLLKVRGKLEYLHGNLEEFTNDAEFLETEVKRYTKLVDNASFRWGGGELGRSSK